MLKDILLALPAWPDTATPAAVEKAADIAKFLDSHLNCIIAEPRVPMPISRRPYGPQLEKLLGERQSEARNSAVAQKAAFEDTASRAGILSTARIAKVADGSQMSDMFVEQARLRDLTIMPFVADNDASRDMVQALVFESGRPVLVLPQDSQAGFRLDKVVVAWDGGRSAARAVGDALPLLQRAGDVRIISIANDKQMPDEASGAELAVSLARNGVKVTFEEIEKGRRSVGEALAEASGGADLVVMGAFGHSRIRDFFLGGATLHTLRKPLRPTLLSH